MSLPSIRRQSAWSSPRRSLLLLLAVAGAALAGCTTPQNVPVRSGQGQAAAPSAPVPVVTAPAAPVVPGSPGAPIRIGLLLPLSGNSAGLGQAMLQAAQMALFDVGGDDVALVVRDTEAVPEGAPAAARAAIDDGARILLGPVFASAAKAVGPVAQPLGVPVISFSSDRDAAGGGVFVMGMLPQGQVDRVVGYASSQGVHRFAALAPSTAYGTRVASALQDSVAHYNGQLVDTQFYDPASRDPSEAVKALARSVGAEGDAVMLAESGDRLRIVAPLLPYFDIDPSKVHLLGTMQWDDPSLAAEPALVGGWYAAPPAESWTAFAQRYMAAYGSSPPRLASLAYDAATLALALAKRGPDFSTAALTEPAGFSGVDGIFRFTPDGVVQRGLAVYEIRKDGPAQIDPAPASFAVLTQ